MTLTQTGPWTAPAGVDTITVELIGPGGNGGTNGGGGGGGGGYVRRTVAVQPGSTISFVVGTGGSGLGTIAGGLGLIAEAGANGTSVPNPNIGGGGAGGAGIGGTVNRSGGPGGGGYWTYFGGGGGGAAGAQGNGGPGGNTIAWNGNCLTPGGAGGSGGGAPAGAGGKGAGFTDANCTVTDPEGHGGAFGRRRWRQRHRFARWHGRRWRGDHHVEHVHRPGGARCLGRPACGGVGGPRGAAQCPGGRVVHAGGCARRGAVQRIGGRPRPLHGPAPGRVGRARAHRHAGAGAEGGGAGAVAVRGPICAPTTCVPFLQ
ncbi:MAG: hypothetical protein IPG35_15200 [Flavobacteriales bacterium]|nr:hypothetical protein [Flavobacteriales bacterium]